MNSDEHTKPRHDLLRLKDIIAPRGPLPVSRSTFYAEVRAGRFPRPLRLGRNISVWRAEDIRDLVARLEVR